MNNNSEKELKALQKKVKELERIIYTNDRLIEIFMMQPGYESVDLEKLKRELIESENTRKKT